MDWQPLIEVATAAQGRAHAPYSDFKVGAAVRMDDGTVHPGCNVENSSFGGTICAERVAVTSAIASGAGRRLEAVVVVSDPDPPAPPCGICLQVLADFGDPDLPVLLVSSQGARREGRLGDFLPHPFDFGGHNT